MNEALDARFEPYGYESTRPILRWLFLALLAFTVAGAFAIYADTSFRNTVSDWRSEGLTEIPVSPEDVAQATLIADLELRDPDQLLCNEEELASGSVVGQGCRSIERVVEYAQLEGLECTTLEQLASVVQDAEAPGCDRVLDITTEFDDLNSRSNIMNIILVFLLIATAFPFASFTHRASRNLRTMKSVGQKHSPDGAVIRFFIPVLNIYKPLFVFVELFKASDPRVPEGDPEAWKKKGTPSPVAVLWGLAWGAVLIFNPITVARIFFRNRADLPDVTSATGGLIAADILIVILGVTAILMANTLSRWQDLKAAKYGTVTVTPERPRDPLERALEEGVRRRDRTGDDKIERKPKRRSR